MVAMGEARAQTTSHIHMSVFIYLNISFYFSASDCFYLVFFLVSSASAGLVSWRGQEWRAALLIAHVTLTNTSPGRPSLANKRSFAVCLPPQPVSIPHAPPQPCRGLKDWEQAPLLLTVLYRSSNHSRIFFAFYDTSSKFYSQIDAAISSVIIFH